MAERPGLTVCFNGSCPVCRAEIEHYRRLAGEDAGIAWLDVAADPAAAERLGIGGEAGFRRLHSVDAAGRVQAGLAAFDSLWSRLPRYRRLARLARWPVLRPLMSAVYERILAPAVYALHRRRQARHG